MSCVYWTAVARASERCKVSSNSSVKQEKFVWAEEKVANKKRQDEQGEGEAEGIEVNWEEKRSSVERERREEREKKYKYHFTKKTCTKSLVEPFKVESYFW